MTEQHTPPPVMREGSRAWVDVPLDSPYATRLRKFGAHWDAASSRWWVGITKADALEQLLALPLGSPVDEPAAASGAVRSAAALLVDMACEDYTLGVTDTGEPFGIRRDTPHLAMMLRGGRTGLRAELAHRFWDTYQTPAPQQALADACLVLEGLAAQEDPQPVHLRIAEHDGAVYLDMGDVDGQRHRHPRRRVGHREDRAGAVPPHQAHRRDARTRCRRRLLQLESCGSSCRCPPATGR